MSGSIQVDASIPLRAGQGVPAPANPLTQYGDFLRLQSAVNQNKLFPGVQQRQQQDIQLGDQAIAAGQLKQAADRGTAAYRTFGPLLAKGTAVTPDDVYGALGQASAIGLPVDAAIQEAHASMPVGGDPKTLGVRMADWVKGRFGTTLSGPEQVGAFVGTPGEQNAGGEIKSGLRGGALSSAPAAFAPASSTRLGISPSEASERVIVGYDQKSGAPIMGPKSTVTPASLGGTAGSGGAPGDGVSGLPAGLRRQSSAASAAPATQEDSSLVSAPDPQVMERNKADQLAYQADQRAVPTHQTAVQTLQKAQHALDLTTTGHSTEAVHNLKSFLVAQGVVGADRLEESVANYDLFRKYAVDYARRTAGASGTNLQLEAAEGSNANPGINTAANRAVLQTNIGRERQAIAQSMESPDKQTGRGHIEHTSTFSNNTDPRGFGFDSYTPEELKKMVDGMTDTEQKKFYKSVGIAKRLKLLNPQ